MDQSIILSLGSNIPDRKRHLKNGVERLQKKGFLVEKISHLYRSEPVEGAAGKYFYNLVVEGLFEGKPNDLLKLLQEIEREEGRISKGDLLARTLDIDIIFFGSQITDNDNLKIPHPKLYNRLFVLEPLVEIEPSFLCPVTGKTALELKNEGSFDVSVERQEDNLF